MVTDLHVFMSRETTRDRAFSAFLIFSYKYACMLSLSMQPNLMSHLRSFALTVASTVVYSVTTHGRKCCDNIFLQLNFILRSLSKMLRCWPTWQWQNVKRKLKDSRFSGRQTGGVFFFSRDPFLPLLWLIKISTLFVTLELAQGGCMGLYRWNSGGQYRGKLWEQDLLADSQVCFDLVFVKQQLPQN